MFKNEEYSSFLNIFTKTSINNLINLLNINLTILLINNLINKQSY